ALFVLFGLLMAGTAWNMSRRRRAADRDWPPSPLADRLDLHGAYYDQAARREVTYRVTRVGLGFTVSGLAGVASGLLGIGGGVLKVPVMNLLMGIPIKACTATSNFMIGVTAAAGAAVWFMRGEVRAEVAAPVALGVLLGAKTGALMMNRIHGNIIKIIFVVILALTAAQMLWKGLR
ncbi:MAG: sulfite exporter TauE/SafE family protein, partial [Verrucomicrobiales bacterium]|nr:sulfite exporter TauE/SafE family protein [Verrucomicrobiales bacterium]